MTMDDTPSGDADGPGSDEPVPHVALSVGRSTRPPAKVFSKTTLAQRSLMGPQNPPGTLLERLHGPVVKWQRHPAPKAGPVAPTRAVTQEPAPAPAKKGENMSERFISERLMSDRGTSFNPQIPRRVPDIPSPASVKAAEADTEGKRLIIGRAVKMSGEIGGCEKLVVEGSADATLHDVKVLEVGAGGTFKGTAAVDSAVVAGTFEGTLKVTGHLEIGASASVKGTVSYGSIAVANGGKLLGTIESAS